MTSNGRTLNQLRKWVDRRIQDVIQARAQARFPRVTYTLDGELRAFRLMQRILAERVNNGETA